MVLLAQESAQSGTDCQVLKHSLEVEVTSGHVYGPKVLSSAFAIPVMLGGDTPEGNIEVAG